MINIIIKKMINYFNGDVKRINHALKVYGFAGCIAWLEGLGEPDIMTVNIASLLHDIGIITAEKKYNSSSGRYQEIEGPGVAREILSDLTIDGNILERACFIIGHHHSYNMIDGTDFQIIVEADFLVNIDEERLSKKSIELICDK